MTAARHNQRVRDWRPGQLSAVLADKAEALGIAVVIVDERSTSSTCPACAAGVAKPRGRRFCCPHCALVAHRDLVGATNIAARHPGGGERVSIPETQEALDRPISPDGRDPDRVRRPPGFRAVRSSRQGGTMPGWLGGRGR